MQEKVKILKVNFDRITLEQANKLVSNWLGEKKQRYICTPNPEFLLEAQKNHKFLKILNKSDLNIADGIGILWAAKYKSLIKTNYKVTNFLKWLKSLIFVVFHPKYLKQILPERVTGVDLMKKIIDESQKTKAAVFLLGAGEGIAEITKETLEKKYPQINIVGTHSGSPKLKDEKEIIKKINIASPSILFVAFGAPTQEMWIHRNLKNLPSLKVAMGVGGSFDFIAGAKKRAPKWMQKLGIEWLYRLIQEPKRIRRIYNATIKFPILILKKSFK